jgi:Cd2+/Zn2+-exporting ATPase
VIAEVAGKQIACGNEKLMQQLKIAYKTCQESGTVVYVAVDGSFAGSIVISDALKPTAVQAIRLLKTKRCVMLTGDREAAAAQIANTLGIPQYHSQLLPADKVSKVEQLLAAQSRGSKLAFVGDGINDAPVLTRADIGIAMGAMGSDAAIEAADVVLMDDDPRKLALAIAIARKTLSIVRQNIVFSLVIKIGCLLLTAVGITNMWWAIFADVGVMVLAVLNATRALKAPRL